MARPRALACGLRLLAALNDLETATVSGLVKETNLPKATVIGLLHTLHAEGYAAQDPETLTYRVTPTNDFVCVHSGRLPARRCDRRGRGRPSFDRASGIQRNDRLDIACGCFRSLVLCRHAAYRGAKNIPRRAKRHGASRGMRKASPPFKLP